MTSFPVKVGRSEHGTDVVVDLADAWHIGVQGATRSGKSVLTYLLLGSLAHRPEVVICGIDPTGILLNGWRDYPGAQYRHIRNDMALGADALGAVLEEMDRRIDLLLQMELDKFSDFTPDMPLMVVVMEEYPGTLAMAEAEDQAEGRKPAERVETRIKRAVQRLVQEGAKVGIRVLLIAQRFEASIVGGAIRSNIGARFTMRVDNDDSVRMMHPRATPDEMDRVDSFRPGMAFFETPGVPGRVVMATDYLDYATYMDVLRNNTPHHLRWS